MPSDAMPAPVPDGALALWLVEQAARRGAVLHVASDAGQMQSVSAAARFFAGSAVEVLPLPPWDVLPYDRTAPHARIVGRRVATLRRLARPADRPRLVLTTADAALQRVQPMTAWAGDALMLRPGERCDLAALRGALAALGYRHLDDRVDEPGEVALRGQVLDLFPAATDLPVRLLLDQGVITEIRRFDPATQRSLDPLPQIVLEEAIEFPPDPAEIAAAILVMADPDLAGRRPDAMEPPARLVPVFDYLDGYAAVVDPAAGPRWRDTRDAVDDAFAAASRVRRIQASAGQGVLPPPNRLYLTAEAVEAALAERDVLTPDPAEPIPRASRLSTLARQVRDASGQVFVACADPAPVAKALHRAGLPASVAQAWPCQGYDGAACLALPLRQGFRRKGLTVLCAPAAAAAGTANALLAADDPPQSGDMVVHLGHGVARLRGLVQVGEEERIALEFADGADLLVPVDELDQVWRYGGDMDSVSLDRLTGQAWTRKRLELDAELSLAARHLAEQAARRAAQQGHAVVPPKAPLDRIARRFGYQPSPDQQGAIDAVLADLGQCRPMDRLVCGDVGFGKTEVALRAAAAVALAGLQVAVAAPTTVLARQHLETFRRRFARTGIRVEGMFGALREAEARAIRQAVAAGQVHVLIGTQAVAAADVRFARLGLVVVDEEQRFGEALKAHLAGLRSNQAVMPHVLTLTATPIPRTTQAALAGLREVSTITTAPVQRQPTRTFVLPWDLVVIRGALLRERARGGQSFLVCPRIEDLARWAARLREAAPELAVVQAHGRMKPAELEDAVVGFANGAGDVLLATNIIEAGLDIPRANTILVADAERFGLAQLHQLRGRVGRGARRGMAYLMLEPGRALSPATQRRLRMMETIEGLGAGARIALADLELRGAGDLFGDAQAGHVRAIGTALYQHLLARAVAVQRGEPDALAAPQMQTGLTGRFPEEWVPEDDLRIALYARLVRMATVAAVDAFAEEIEDRFGPLPVPARRLLDLMRLRCRCVARQLTRIDAGPQAVALTPADPFDLPILAEQLGGTVRGVRLVVPLAVADAAERVAKLADMLTH